MAAHALTHSHDWIADTVSNLPELLTTDEVVRVLRTSRRNLYRWISIGKLSAVKSGLGGSARILVPRAAIAAFLRQMEAA